MTPKAGTLILAGLVLTAVVCATPVDAGEPRARTTLRAVVKGLTNGKACVLRLVANGAVQGAASCGWNVALARVERWRRSAACICLLDGERKLLLAFRATEGVAFRAQDVDPETLEMRLLAATSTPLGP